mmetsp:Transcript_19920/g.29800  ORF Transcript_19920/g.29800 Transcript_19920/m.29800 type:complete len:295 (+) Transcript_19920:105-989(+)|eukprot:CAMPEP_0167759574 /NCGR_PEP_ID=MMETSP0110_2-20121227/11101_1 /TAXON_ID=629695 /ORGANISM="Gymnochlora sp., Strain CCMP2014" /LENGTH=294 /DNA_ID=CAMNT_0007645979 /DNA_START=46 /DNA_END=930 /DNA_ORIENTATION=-
MGRRHALNNTARSYFTSWEKKEAGYGTKTARVGSDYKLPFGHCRLGLQMAVDPVVSPSGHIYSREAILEYLLTQKEQLSKARKAWEKEQEVLEKQKGKEEVVSEQKEIENFIKTEERVVSRKRKAENPEEKMKEFLYQPHKVGEIIMNPLSKKEKQKQLQRTSFWLPQFTPSSKKQKLDKPRKRPPSPFSRRPLRLKDLTPIKLKVLDPDAKEKKFCCMVSGKEITYQDVIFIKKTGTVILKKLYDDLVKEKMRCPITSKSFKKKDVILIKNEGSGFAATGNVIAKQWEESLMN